MAALVEAGTAEDVARKQTKVAVPRKPEVQTAWIASCGDSRAGQDGACPWFHEVSTYCFPSAFKDGPVQGLLPHPITT